MVYIADDHDPVAKQDITQPETPYESRVCNFTLVCSLAFIAAGAYYFLGGPDDGIQTMLMIVTGGLFGISLLNFFLAAFCGKLCGGKKT